MHKFMRENCEAFVFGRTDWEYVNNTFVYPVRIGYHFIETKAGAANGQFVCMHGDQRIEVLVEKTCTGSVRLVNCAFWGPARQCVVSHGRGFVSLSDCYLSANGRKANPGVFLVEADGGRLQVRGCSFGSDEPDIALRPGLRHAIIAVNNGVQGLELLNEIGSKAIIVNNEPQPPPPATR